MSSVFINYRNSSKIRKKLYVFPHSGSGPGSYLNWEKHLIGIDVIGIQYPGRGSLSSMSPSTSIESLAEFIVREATDGQFDGDFHFFGHSIGAAVAFSTAAVLNRRGRDFPGTLILSSLPAPKHLSKYKLNIVTIDDLVDQTSKFSSESAALLRDDPELANHFLQLLRSDLQMLDGYIPPTDYKYSGNINLLYGSSDKLQVDHMLAWKEFCTGSERLSEFNGGHFYFNEDPVPFFLKLNEILEVPKSHSMKATHSYTKRAYKADLFSDDEIAIVGMAAAYPKASDCQTFWKALLEKQNLITEYSIEEVCGFLKCDENEISEDQVLSYAMLDNVTSFDPKFFRLSNRDALLLDPQQRIFLETTWRALEDAAIDPDRYARNIGIYAGCGDSNYISNLKEYRHNFGEISDWELSLSTSKDFFCSRISYLLNLKGPSVTVQTACSTSLVAIHQAAQALAVGDCDTALAGGATIRSLPKFGVYAEGGYLSRDGTCRPFDKESNGTVGGSGAGVVVLKRVADAIEDNDKIYATIRGSAVNNDGREKIGFTAPSVSGQLSAMTNALMYSGVLPENIDFVEAHGTATALGDAIELAALKRAYLIKSPTKKIFLGSVKSNIGHTDTAAGVAGFIKSVKVVQTGKVPATRYFKEANPRLEGGLEQFEVNSEKKCLPKKKGSRRNVAINSLGLGGTNAHIIVGEAKHEQIPIKNQKNRSELVVLSGYSNQSLGKSISNMSNWLKDNDDYHLVDIARMTQDGRKHFPVRKHIISNNIADLRQQLTDSSDHSTRKKSYQNSEIKNILLFPGQGGQHIGMAADLYQYNSTFNKNMKECITLFSQQGVFIEPFITKSGNRTALKIRTTIEAHAFLFSVEYCLGRLILDSLSERPHGLIGHSLGSYAAACLAGVFSLTDVCSLIIERAKLFGKVTDGAMMAVLGDKNTLEPSISPSLSIAAINAEDQFVVSGDKGEIEDLATVLSNQDIDCRILNIFTAGHSKKLEPYIDSFHEFMKTLDYATPELPIVSDQTGNWLSDKEARSPEYWAQHMLNPVMFDDAIAMLLSEVDSPLNFIEVGPGHTLISLVKRHRLFGSNTHTAKTLPHPKEDDGDYAVFLSGMGSCWEFGCSLNFKAFSQHDFFNNIPIPGASFDRIDLDLQRFFGHQTSTPFETKPASEREKTVYQPDCSKSTNSSEMTIVSFFHKILADNKLNSESNFFDSGGDSLNALQLCRMMNSHFDIKLSPLEVFKNPTPLLLSTLLKNA